MNVLERAQWLSAVAACVPQARVDRMKDAAAALEKGAEGRWEASVCARGLAHAGLRFFGAGAFAPWKAACGKALGLPESAGPETPAPGLPWLAASWDLATGRWTAARLFGAAGGARGARGRGEAEAWDFAPGGKAPAKRALTEAPYKRGAFGEAALDAALEDFSALCPLEALVSDGMGWSLRLARPLRWPLFARSDLANSFAKDSSQLGLLLRDRSVTELSFDGKALWAHCAG